MSSTQATRKRLLDAGVPFGINANVAEYLRPGEGETIQAEVEQHLQPCLRLGYRHRRDHNTTATAKRIAKMYVRQVFVERFEPSPAATELAKRGLPARDLRACLHHREIGVLAPLCSGHWHFH
ncbi:MULTISPECIES: hypothetical protein [unclassified Bradyrhizobium]|uniref:hypothetical protein n=1 Tax=unclassified Bradyrhizobium TaxID=2631580 RepID=UPI001FF7C78E|nr:MULTISPECIES: hypothetical protein [unclassified Bradyrhizobium]MCK1613482.1 hypothetical protein [Bradyrhizobium sp. 163]MCK1767336.1 hypothetical protein [Bradyrhizobium sp. 136]